MTAEICARELWLLVWLMLPMFADFGVSDCCVLDMFLHFLNFRSFGYF